MANVNQWYPNYRKAIIEAWRIFAPAFIAAVWLQVQLGSAGFDDLGAYLKALVVAGILGGVKAVVKWVRETYGQGNYTHWSYKLPI